jgi:hypothetical protein
MAIGLASAIGLQRKSNVLEGLGESVSKAGSQIVAAAEMGQEKKRKEDEKKADAAYDQISKFTSATAQVEGEHDDPAFKEQGDRSIARIKELWRQGASKQRIQEEGLKLYGELIDAKTKMEQDLKDINAINKFESENAKDEGYDVSDARAFLKNPSQVLPEEERKKYEGKGYFELPLDVRKKIASTGLADEYKKLLVENVGSFDKAIGSYFPNYKPFEEYTNLVTTDSPTGIQTQKVEYNEDKIANDRKQFLASYDDYQNLPQLEVKKYWKGLENRAKKALVDTAQEVNPETIKEWVTDVAKKEFNNGVEAVKAQRKITKIDLNPEDSGDGSGGSKSNQTRVGQVTEQMPPALTQKLNDEAKKLEEEAKVIEKKAKKLRAGYANIKGPEKYKEPSQSVKNIEEFAKRKRVEAEALRNKKVPFEQYYVFSSVNTSQDPNLSLTDANNNTIERFNPSYVYKQNGQFFIGGTAPRVEDGKIVSGEYVDAFVPYNQANYETLQANRPKLVSILTQKGYPSFETSTKPATQKQEPAKQKAQIIEGKTIPAGGKAVYSKATGKLLGYELNGEKFKF